MIEHPEAEQKVAIESPEISLNFDSRVVGGLVVKVRALAEHESNEVSLATRISVSWMGDGSPVTSYDAFSEIARAECSLLEQKRKEFPDSDVLLNHLASLYVVLEEYQSALQVLREGVERVDSPLLRNRLANLLIERGEVTEAEKLLERTSEDWAVPTALNRAYMCVKKGDVQGAKQHINAALDVDGFDYSARLLAGAICIWGGEYAEAIRSFKVATEERPKSAIPLVHMAAAYFALNQRSKALSTLRKATYLNPLDDRAVVFYSDLLFLSGRAELAIRPLAQIYEIWEEQTTQSVVDRLAKAYIDEAQTGKALQLLQKRLPQSPDNPSLLNNAGVALWKRGKGEEAKKFLVSATQRLLASDEDLSLARAIPITNLLGLLHADEDHDVALKYAKALLRRAEETSDQGLRVEALVWYVDSLTGLGQRKEACELAEHAVQTLGRAEPSIYKLLSVLLHHYSVVSPNKKRVEELSKEVFGAATRKDIDEKIRLHSANNALFALLHFDEVRQVGSKLSLITKYVLKNPYATATAGLYYLKRNNFSKGKALYDRAIQLADNPKLKSRIRQRMALELAKRYIAKKETKEAKYWLERSLKEKFAFDFAREEALSLRSLLLQL
jgi:predicted Zn-dependent protease